MKKLILIVVIGFLFVTQSFAQSATTIPLAVGDTVVNSGTASKTISSTGGYAGVVITPIITKQSGTIAGTVILYESIDGTNYKSTGDTLTLGNTADNRTSWHKTSPLNVYYKITSAGSGTMAGLFTVKYVFRKYQN